jgi:hypothetical protein
MSKHKGTRPDGPFQQGSGEPDENDKGTEERGQFAGGNRGIQDDKSQGSEADHGQRGGQGGQKRGGNKS